MDSLISFLQKISQTPRRKRSVRSLAYSLLLAFLLTTLTVFAQKNVGKPERMQETVKATSEGRDFWVCFQKNDNESKRDPRTGKLPQLNQLFLELFITSNEDTRVRIEIDGLLFKQESRIRGGTVLQVRIDTAAQVRSSEVPERLAVHITSEKPVSVYGLSHRFQTTDSFMGLPVEALGTEYRAIAYYRLTESLIGQLAVIATDDSTSVTITPTSLTAAGRPANVPFTVQLRKGDVYQVSGASAGKSLVSDLTGTLVQSNKPIAVFSGHSGAYIPIPEQGYNHLVEQLPPVSAWGRHYYVGKFFGRTKSTIRVVAAENDTKVFSNGQLVSVLNAGEFYEDGNVTSHTQITGDKRIMVAQFAHGYVNSLDSIGDPMMILITPTQQFLKHYRMATPIRGEWRHYVNIVVPRQAASSLRIDGKPVSEKAFVPFGESRYDLAQISLGFGTHTFDCNEPFGLYSYGFGYGQDSYDAYGNMIGQSFLQLTAVKDTLPPTMDILYTKSQNAAREKTPTSNNGEQTTAKLLQRTLADSLTAEEQFEQLLQRRALARLQLSDGEVGGRLLKPLTAAASGRAKILIRDDREDDRGLASARVINSGGLVLSEPIVSAGAPQAELAFDETLQTGSGRALLELSDIAGNKSIYTLCFAKDQLGTDNLLTLTQGETDYCPKRTLWYAGVYGSVGITTHDARFGALPGIPAVGTFSSDQSASILPTGVGVVLGHRLSSLLGVSVRAGLERFPGSLRAADTVVAGSVRLLDGSLAPLWLAQTLSLQNSYLSLTLAGEIFITNNFYALLGVKAAYALSKAVDSRAEVVTPDNFKLLDRPENKARTLTGELPALQTLIPSAVGGMGITLPVWRNIAFCAEALYSYPLGSVVDGGSWRISQVTLNIGARVRL
ncbi:MAG: IgGFc-binding protein [Ignavibacteria bacterium]|nr:IgGFc-binding protein [Ignavibacteria bacterium]